MEKCDKFWSRFVPATQRFCEDYVCGFVTHPAETWTNIGYFVVAYFLYQHIPRHDPMRRLALSALCVGVGSTLFHASGTWLGEFCDISSMFLFSSFLIARNWARAFSQSPRHETVAYWTFVVGSSALLWWLPPVGTNLFILHIVLAGCFEFICLFRKRQFSFRRYRSLFVVILFFGVAYSFWWVDRLEAWCPPTHWLTGHGLWHLFNAPCFWFAYQFYRRSDV